MSRRSARRHHPLRSLLLVLVVIAAFVVAADRIGVLVAEEVAGSTIEKSQHLNEKPDVDIAGIPFLTQLGAGEFGQVTITAHNLEVGDTGHRLRLSTMRVVLHDVHVSRSFDSVRADTADATAVASYADLSRALGVTVASAGNGRIRATEKVTLLGHTLSASVTTTPRLVNGALGFISTTVNGLGAAGGDVVNRLSKMFDLSVPLQGIPFKVRVRSLQIGDQGLTVVLGGRDLSYSKS